MAQHELAVQLYTLRNETARDFRATLQEVAEAGVPAVEFAGFGSHSASDMRGMLDEFGIIAMGAHVGYQLLDTQLDQVIEDIQALGAKHLACPGIFPRDALKTADDFRRAGEALGRMGERCKAAGLRLSYHCHDHEFAEFDGKYGLDLLFEATDPDNLATQLDLGWVAYAGVDPVAYLRKYAGRAPTVHFKDMIKEPKRYDVPTGEGILPIPDLVATGREGGTEWFIVELDQPREAPIECVRRSVAYLNSQGVQ
jgi:sugar phosphate isomerase/epimerase